MALEAKRIYLECENLKVIVDGWELTRNIILYIIYICPLFGKC